MAIVKTAISMDGDLFARAETAAQAMQITRSRLMAIALETYLKQWENERLLEAMNAAYADLPDDQEEEARLADLMWRQRRNVAPEDPW